MHTVFTGTFGVDFLVVAFHLITLGGYGALAFLARKAAAN